MSDQVENPISLTAQDIRDFDFEAILLKPANSPLGRQKDHTYLNYELHCLVSGQVDVSEIERLS